MGSAQHPADAQLLRSAFGSGISERFANALALSRDRARQAEPTQKSPAAGRLGALVGAFTRSGALSPAGPERENESTGDYWRSTKVRAQTLLAPSASLPPHIVRDVWGLC